MTEDVLTFEELRRAQSRERDMDTLQDLDEDFFDRARNYLDLKRSPDSHLENREYRNAKHIVEDILDMRQRKIMKLAFLSVKSNVQIDNILDREQALFEDAAALIEDYRGQVHGDLFDGPPADGPDTTAAPTADADEAAAPADPDAPAPDQDAAEGGSVDPAPEDGPKDEADAAEPDIAEANGDDDPTTPTDADDTEADGEAGEADAADDAAAQAPGEDAADGDDTADEDDGAVAVEIVAEVPEFMGVDLKAYGPYEDGDTAELPERNAEVLIDQGKAEPVEA